MKIGDIINSDDISDSNVYWYEDKQMTIKKVPLKWKGEDATLILIIDNTEVIKG